AAFWLAALGARPTAHPHVAARSSWRSVTRRAVRAARAPRDRSAEAGPCRVAALANAWSAAGQRRAVVRPAQMVPGCLPLAPRAAGHAPPRAAPLRPTPARPPVTVARLLVAPTRAGHTGLAGGCAAVVAGRPEFAGKRQVRRGVIGLGPAVADQLGRPPLRHP